MSASSSLSSVSSSQQQQHERGRGPQHAAARVSSLVDSHDEVNVLRQTPPSAAHYSSKNNSNGRTMMNGSYYFMTPHQQQQHHAPRNTTGRRRPYSASSRLPPTPLVLDPSAAAAAASVVSSSASSSSFYSADMTMMTTPRQHSQPSGGGGTVRKLLEAASSSSKSRQRTRQDTATSNDDDPPFSSSQDINTTTTTTTAASFARTAPRAGFLQKLGTNIPQFKRRFFVLQPSTHLYYFLSPTDTTPRGCVDLNQLSTVEPIETLPDGRVRFALVWANHNHDYHHDDNESSRQHHNNHKIVLEARNAEVAEQWMESLRTERLSAARRDVQQCQERIVDYQAQVHDLQQQLKTYKYVEQEKEEAQEDAANWKRQFEKLNEGLRLLTLHLRRAPEEEKRTSDLGSAKEASERDSSPADTPQEGSQADSSPAVESPSDDENVDERRESTSESTTTSSSSSPPPTNNISHRETSLLDAISEVERPIEEIEIPGTHFAALTNVCQQLRESVRLASIEASTAVEDLQTANEKVAASEKRMAKAEKHICKLWEENCEIRKSLKQSKQEKKILVREVKNMQAREQAERMKPDVEDRSVQTDATSPDLGEEGERLIDEIEEHVMSSIRLHEQFLGVNAGLGNELIKSAQQIESGTYTEMSPARVDQTSDSDLTRRIENRAQNDASLATSTDETRASSRMSPLRPSVLSLFDEDSDDGEESDGEEDEHSRATSALSSVGAEYGDADSHDHTGHNALPQSRPEPNTSSSDFDRLLAGESESEQSVSLESHDDESTSQRKHPLLKLDEPDDGIPPNLCGSSTQSESSKSVITDTEATTRLSCPLADVVETRKGDQAEAREDGRVYHLTFYSRKIGLQFQKVPAEQSVKGLLTDAMTADLPSNAVKATGAETTAAELQRIAAISSRVNQQRSKAGKEDVLQVATPVDAVLVCGFHGFDDSTSHTRPKLGARLVAFDGISVEVGKWTFDSVRKAIKARGRPLTLSFRNDFLSSKQRSILTKAVAEIQAALPPRPHPALQYVNKQQKSIPSEPASIASAASHETDEFLNEYGPEDSDVMGRSFSTTHSVASSYQSTNYRSFSNAGSSSVVSSTIGPLMSNLMTGLSRSKSRDSSEASEIPQYLRHDAESLENTAHYNDFKSSLL